MILLIAAMDEEIEALKKISKNPQTFDYEDISVSIAQIEEEKVLIAKSGIGKVNAAYTTSILINHFRPSLLINTGSAGGLLEGQNIGDIVVADSCQYHDLDIGPGTAEDSRFIFSPHRETVMRVKQLLERKFISYTLGCVLTGDQFIQKGSYAFTHLKEWFPQAVCAEMEAAAIASVAQRTKVPFVILRGLSDLIFKEGNEVDFEKYLLTASEKSAEICRALLYDLRKNPS